MSDLDRLEDFIKAIARETQWNTGQALIGLQRLRQQMEQQEASLRLVEEAVGGKA